MSLLGYDMTGTATINGLTEINANNVWSDVLYYDAGTTPVNVKTAIDGISVDITALEADVLTLQGQMTTVQGQITTLDGEVNTLQSEMNTAQSDINTLQSDMNTAQADIIALGVTTGATAVTVAALVISQAAQDVTLATHSGQIATLQVEMNTAQSDITDLEVKTTDQSWASIGKTTFSTKLNVGTTSAGVILNTATISEFGSGIKTDTINSDNTMTLTADGFAINATTAGVQTFATSSTLIQSTTTTTLTSGGETEINCSNLDINATGAVTIDSTSTIDITGTTNTILGITNINTTGALATSIGNTGAIVATGSTITTTSSGTTQINSGTLDINATAAASLDATSIALTASTGNMTWTTSATGDFNITSGRNVNFVTNSTGAIMNCTSNKDQDIFKVNNTSFDSKFLIGSATTGFRQTVNNNSYANLDGLGSTKINMSTNNGDITFNAGGGNTVIVDPTTMFNLIPTASIITRVIASVPSGYLLCDGGAISRTTYSRLFTAISTTFGAGDGSTTFNKPNFQGAFLRGSGSQTVSGTTHTAAAVGTAQADDVLEHLHTYSDLYWWDDNTAPSGSTRVLSGTDYQVPGGDNNGLNADGGQTKVMTSSAVYAAGATQANAATTPSPAIGSETRPMNYSVYYLIRY